MFTFAGRVSAKRIESATSSGRIGRPIATFAYTARAFSSSPPNRTREKSVSTRPGATFVIRTGFPWRSSRNARVSPYTANFDATFDEPFAHDQTPAIQTRL